MRESPAPGTLQFIGSDCPHCHRVLEQLSLSDVPQTRADACHFLGLAHNRRTIPAERRLLDDENADVREIDLETLALFGDGGEGDE